MKSLVFLFVLFATTVSAQTTFTYANTADPTKAYSERAKTTVFTVAANLAVITIVEGKAAPVTTKYKVVSIGTALKGEYNLVIESGDRFYIAPGYAMLYSKENVAKRVWTNNQIAIR